MGRQKAKKAETSINKHDDDVKLHAKKFTLLYELFIPSDDSFFRQPKPVAVDLWSPGRYHDEASQTRAILAELYLVFPERLHAFISGHSKFNTDVCHKLIMMSHSLTNEIFKFRLYSKAMRSQLIERARSVAAQVFKLPAEYFKSTFDRTTVPELQGLLKFDINSRVVSKFVPVLYPSGSRSVRKDSLLFQASEPALVCKCAPHYRRQLLISIWLWYSF